MSQENDLVMGERRGMKALELWCRRVTEGYPGVKIDNMTTSWRDGLAFCALIHHFRPDLIDFDRLDKREILKNNELAFRVAERQLGIPALLDAEDMLEYEIPDRLSILTYLSQFYQAFAQQGSSPSARKHNSSHTEILTPSPSNPTVKVGRGRVERCSACDRPVFLAERLVVGGKLRHRSCFSCARCRHHLNPVSCYETETGDYVCEMCPDEEKSYGAESVKEVRDGLTEPDASLPPNPGQPSPDSKVIVPVTDGVYPPHLDLKSEEPGDSLADVDAEVKPLCPEEVSSGDSLRAKPPDPSKFKFLSDILDGNKTELCTEVSSTVNEVSDLKPPLSNLAECLEKDSSLDSDKNKLEVNKLDNDIVDINEDDISHDEGKHENVDNNSLGDLKIEKDEESKNDNLPSECKLEAEDKNLEIIVSPLEDLKADQLEDKNETDEIVKPELTETLDVNVLTDRLKSVDVDNVEFMEVPVETSEGEKQNDTISTLDSSVEEVHDTTITITDVEDSITYPTSLNPFGDSEEEEEKPTVPVPSVRTCRKVKVNSDGKTIVEAPKHMNPFWSESDEESDESSKPRPAPRTLRTPDPIPRNRFGSSTSLTSQSSSAGKKKKRPAPQPPSSTESLLRRPPSPVSSLSSPSSYASRSPALTRRRKSRPAPPPPIKFDKERKDYENKVKQNLSPPDKSTYGKWKRKKGAAPGLPIPPQRRRILVVPLGDVHQEVEDLEVQQAELERQGVRLEQAIRNSEEGGEEGSSTAEKDMEEMVLQLFEIVNKKNELFRRQAELMFLRKQQRLEEEHADIEYQIRCLMGRPKNEADPILEEELIGRLVDVVERRNEIIECLDMNRKRAVEEDQSIHDRLQAFTARETSELPTEEEPATSKRTTKNVLKLIKKKREKKKEKEELEKRKDLDVDIDESVPEEGTETKPVKTKKKWFKLDK